MFFGGRKPEKPEKAVKPAEPQSPEERAASAAQQQRMNRPVDLTAVSERLLPLLTQRLGPTTVPSLTRPELSREIKNNLSDLLGPELERMTLLDQRNLVAMMADRILMPRLTEKVLPEIKYRLDPLTIASLDRAQLAKEVKSTMKELMISDVESLSVGSQEQLLNSIVDQMKTNADSELTVGAVLTPESLQRLAEEAGERSIVAQQTKAAIEQQIAEKVKARESATPSAQDLAQQRLSRMGANKTNVEFAKAKIQQVLLERIDTSAAASLQREQLRKEIFPIVNELLSEQRMQLNSAEREELVEQMLDDMLGLGPLEPLLADDSVTDIMVNGAKQVYVERKGKLELTEAQFRDNNHVMTVAQRIVTGVGRRVDESTPLVDARLKDGSRVNIIIPPLAIDGASISIRKFSKKKISLDIMEKQNNISPQMAAVLRIASRARLNIVISGGTGSGKTTLLNALSQMIDVNERIVTIEDAAELQLQQPHVVRLETRPANLEGDGEITMRDLVKNSLRMRPDRIILGEVRGAEAMDMLQAMNTGHDGSLATCHANRPREALMRLENMVSMGALSLPSKAVKQQIASAVHLIVQISRMRDGMRRITYISEIVGMEGEVITMQDLFTFQYRGEDEGGKIIGDFSCTGVRPHFLSRAAYYGLDKELMEAMSG
jgi:pilus assembly protein CpaF